MALSDAQKRAISNYRKKNVKYLNVTFYPNDMDIYIWLKGKTGKNKFVKQLLRDEMNREQTDKTQKDNDE